MLTVPLAFFHLLILSNYSVRVEKGSVVEQIAYLQARAVKSGCDVNCDGVDDGDPRRAKTNDGGTSADA